MKKLALVLIIFGVLCYSEFIFSATITTLNQEPLWRGLYVGGNLGYWRSQTNDITSTGSASYANPIYEPGSINIANALAQITNNSSSLNLYGVLEGAQLGYNYQLRKGFLLGLNIDLDGLSNSNNDLTMQKTAYLADYPESYLGSLTVKEKINYLGTVRARLGYLYTPTFLVYATGGFAYGNVTLDTAWTVQESLGPAVYPAIITQNNPTKTLPGWTAGAGVEWLFKPQWSAMLEYMYYSLNDFNVSNTLTQITNALSPPTNWAGVDTKTSLSVAVWNIRVGLNYHFL